MLITALILACGTVDVDQVVCSSFSPQIVYQTTEECLASIEIGIQQAEMGGWTIVGYECFEWQTKGRLNDLVQGDL